MTYYNYRGVAMKESATDGPYVAGTAAGNETLTSPSGNAALSGEGGGDVLIGSSGDNRFYIRHPNDRVIEQAGGGIDTMESWTATKLAANVENLIVHGDFNFAYGNELSNLIITDGKQWVYGGAGDDVLVGGGNGGRFVVKAGEGNDVIYGWNGNSELQLWNYGFTSAGQIKSAMTQQGTDVLLKFNNGESLTFRNTTIGSFNDNQFLLPLDRSKLGALTFGDEFNTLQTYDYSLQTGQWRTDFGGNLKDHWAYSLVSNNENQVYTDPDFYGRGEQSLNLNPFSINNGVLSITASRIPEDQRWASWGHDYSSGMLNTFSIFEQKYGYFEVRAEMPAAAGAWPAFWMIANPFVPNMEADIFEMLGLTPNVDYRRAVGDGVNQYDNTLRIDSTGFHTYGMLWTPTTVTFYYDDVAVMQGATPANWNQPMALILNLAVGGWGGNPDHSMFPATLKVDYVHAYALADGSSVTTREAPEAPVATLREAGGATSGQANVPVTFSDGQPVTSAHIAEYASRPTTLPPGKTFVVWEDGGAVYGAVSDGTTLGKTVALGASSISQFSGTGTWLSSGKVAVGYFVDGAAGKTAWALVFDPNSNTFTRHELGAGVGDLRFVATEYGGFAASWDTAAGTTMGRGYDEYAYGTDIPGWYGPVRQLAGDLVGYTADHKLIVSLPSGGQQLYSKTIDLQYVPNSPPPPPPPPVSPPPPASPSVLAMSTSSVTLAEGNSGVTAFSYTVTRSGDTSVASSATWTVAGTGTNPASAADFQATTGTVNFAAGETSKVITVNVLGDTTVEQNETFSLTLSNPTGGTLGATVTATGTITNDDTTPTSPPPPPVSPPPPPPPPPPSSGGQDIVSPGPNSTITGTSGADTIHASQGYDVITGGAGADVFTFDKEPWAPITITDFALGTDKLDFSALFRASGYTGSDPVKDKYVYFQADGANTLVLFDRDSTGQAQQYPNYILKLQGVQTTGLTWAQLSGASTPTSPPPPPPVSPPPPASPPVLAMSTSSVTLAEGNSGVTAFSYTVTRSGDTSVASSATWTVAGTGTNPASAADFQATTGTVNFAAGETSKVITVNVLGDTTVEQNETFSLTLSNPTGGTLGATVTATGTITNDDTTPTSPPPPPVSPPPPPPPPPPSSGGQDIVSPGPNSTITGTSGADTIHASQGYDVITGGAGADVFTFDKEPWAPITITDFALGTDKLDFSALFRASGYTGSDPVKDKYVYFQADGANTLVLFDRDSTGQAQQYPNYILKLQGVQTTGLTWAQLSGASTPTSPPPPPPVSPPPPASPPVLAMSTSSVTLAEGNSGVTAFSYTVTRSGDTSVASSATWTVAGTGTNPASAADFQATTGTVNFAAGETSKVITVNVLGDTTVEQNETFSLTLSNPTGGTLGATVTATGTITNDDTASGGQAGRNIVSPGANSTISGTAGDDTIHASQGYDVITGGGGADVFVFDKEPWAPITIKDFTHGVDHLDLRALFDAAGYTGTNPWADGYLYLQSDGKGGTQILFDRDAHAPDQQWPNYIIHLEGIAPSTLTTSDWIIQ